MATMTGQLTIQRDVGVLRSTVRGEDSGQATTDCIRRAGGWFARYCKHCSSRSAQAMVGRLPDHAKRIGPI